MNKSTFSLLKVISYTLILFFGILYILILLSSSLFDYENLYTLFTSTYGVIALTAFCGGLAIANVWGGIKSVIGRALTVLSIGAGLQFAGQIAYTYYLVTTGEEPPYPSIAEFFYFSSIIMFLYGSYLLAEISQVKQDLKTARFKIFAVFVSILLFLAAFGIFYVSHDWEDNSPILLMLELGYPLLQGATVGFCLFTLYGIRNLYGGQALKAVALILTSLLSLYIADTLFLWLPTLVTDGLYLMSYSLMLIGVISFGAIYRNIFDRKGING